MSDGASEGTHRASAAAQFAKMGIKPNWDVLIPAPEFPEPLRYLWNWFKEISLGIASNGMSYPVITWRDLAAWSDLTGQELEPREARNLIGLGNLRANILSETQKKPDAGSR